MRRLILALALCIAGSALAQERTITLTLNEPEVNALVGLMDLGVKSGGLAVAANAAILAGKIDAALKETVAPVPPTTTLHDEPGPLPQPPEKDNLK